MVFKATVKEEPNQEQQHDKTGTQYVCPGKFMHELDSLNAYAKKGTSCRT